MSESRVNQRTLAEGKGKKCKIIMLMLLMLVGGERLSASNPFLVSYLPEDSVLIETLLDDSRRVVEDEPLSLFFARKFIGKPYVAATLEVFDDERLVVNTRELDCTTFVETVVALTLCAQNEQRTFADFVDMLRRLRYRQGEMDGYASRLHYFSEWISDNEAMGFVQEINAPLDLFSARQTLNLGFMTSHSDLYKALKRDSLLVGKLRDYERQASGQTVCYIPKQSLSMPTRLRSVLCDGDIVALQTNINGLDIVHVGFVVWQKDGPHLLHASTNGNVVKTDGQTLSDYMKNKRSQTGIRVVRIKCE